MKKGLISKLLTALLLVGLLFSILPSQQAQAAELCVKVGGADGCYSSIQEAINVAKTGDVISVDAGTYVGDLLLTKPITLQGTGDTTIIEGDIRYQSEDFIPGTMTLKGVMVVDSAAAFRMGAGTVGAFDEVVIDNVTMSENLDKTARAISFDADSDTLTLNRLTIKNSRIHSTLAVYLTGKVGEIDIQNNDFYVTNIHWGAYNAININQYPGVPVAVYSITNNRIHVPDTSYGYATAITNQGLNQLAHGNELTASGNSIQVGTGTSNTDQSTFIKDKVVETNALYTVINQTKGTGYTTIQSAINAADSGDTINVAAGTYAEKLSITKPLTLLGPNADVKGYETRASEATITFPDGLSLDVNSHNNIYVGGIIDNKIDGVTIKGFRFAVPEYMQLLNPRGIRSEHVNNLIIENNFFDGTSEAIRHGGAIDAIHNTFGLIIRGNKIDGGIFKQSRNSFAVHAQAVEVEITDNVISNVYFGFWFKLNYITEPSVVSNNTISTIQEGFRHYSNYTDGAVLTFENNTFTIADPGPLRPQAEATQVYQQIYQGYALNYHVVHFYEDSRVLTLKNNTFDLTAPLDSTLGIRTIFNGGSNSQVTVNALEHNKFLNYTRVANIPAAVKINATESWWGSIAGPDLSTSSFDAGKITYTPWCTDPECNNFKTMLSLSPEVIGEDASCDGTYTVDVVAQLVENMQAYTVEIEFPKDAIEILSVENKAWVNKGLVTQGFGNTLGNDTGRLIMGMLTQRPSLAEEPETFSGTTTLFTITFKAKGVGAEDPEFKLDPTMSYYTDWPNAWRYDFEKFNDATVKVNSVVTNVDTGKGYCDLGLAISEAGEEGHTLRMDADYTTADGYTIAKKLTLNLNGHNITRAGATDANFFRVNAGGDFTATGTGGIKTTDSGNNTIRIVGSATGTAKFTLNGPTIDGTNSSVAIDGNRDEAPFDSKASYEAIFVMDNGKTLETILPQGKGATVVINNGEVRGNAPIQGNGTEKNFGTDITINGGLINGFTNKYEYNGIAIYHPQHGKLTINGGTIIGSNAIEMDAGDLIITGGTITANGDYKDVVDKANHSTDTGDAILVFHRLTYGLADKTVNITISGNPIITSEKAYALREFAPGGNTRLGSLSISGGKFTGAADKGAVLLTTDDTAKEKFVLTNGAYSTDPAVYVYIPLETYLDTDNYYRIKEMDGKLSIPLSGWANYDSGFGWYSGISSEVVLEDAVFTDAKSIIVELRAADGTILQRNTAINIGKYEGFTGFTTPFDINGVFDYATDAYWTNERIGDFGKTTEPACVVANVVLASGKPLTAENCVITGNREDFTPTLVAQDFGVMNFSNVMGYSAGFKPVNFGLHQVTGLKVELFAGTELLQTNLAVQPSDQGNASGISFSGPFDVFGTFDYTKDYVGGSDPQRVYWENTRASEYGQTLSPTRVVATATLPGGLEVVVENTNIYGERAWILPLNVNGVVTLQGQRTFAAVPIAFNGIDGRTSTGYVKNFVTTVDGSFSGDVVFHQEYFVTTHQPRYLNVTLGLAKKIDIQSATTLPPLFLRGGNVFEWEKNTIDTGDVGHCGTYWGQTGDIDADANFDNIVNIQDLAMIGGNLDLTAQQAYGTWLLP